MTIRPYLKMGNNIACECSPTYNQFCTDSSVWLERNISLKLSARLIHNIDKIIYLFDLMIPSFVAIGLTIVSGFALELTLVIMAPGLVPLVAFCLYDVFSRALYPYDYLRDLNQAHLRGELPNIRPHPEVLEAIGTHVSGRNHVMLVGPAGSGKTATLSSFAQYLESEDCPENIKGKRVYHLDVDSLMNDPLNFLVRILLIVQEMSALTNPNALLFIDEAHRMNDRVNGVKLSDFLKPLLEIRHIHMIAATTDRECEKLFRDEAIARRFELVSMPALTEEEVNEIITTKFAHEDVAPTPEAIAAAISRSEEVFPAFALPDRAIKLMRNTMTWKKHRQDRTPVTPQDINTVVSRTRRIPIPPLPPVERIAALLDRVLPLAI